MSAPEADQIALAPMRGRYFVRSRPFNALFRAIDAVLAVFARQFPADRARPVRRLLIANGSHFGDVVMATAVLPAIKEMLPDVRIGMLVGSWGASVVRNHPLLDWVHVVDHWKISRAPTTRPEKLKVYWRTRRQALREMREVDYDCAVDLYFYFPNAIALLRCSGIGQRIGYTSGGFGPLLTQAFDLTLGDRSVIDYHLELLRHVPGLADIRRATAYPSLPRVAIDASRFTGGGRYVVLHAGSGSPLKDWPLPSWLELVRQLSAQGYRLVFTGTGPRERELVARLAAAATDGVDLCDQLKWQEFVEVIASASLLIGVDSVAGHVAAAMRTPVLVVGNGMNNPFLWRPMSPGSVVMMHPMPCAPCYRKTGCAAMTCIRELDPGLVAGQAAAMSGAVDAPLTQGGR